MRRSHRVLAASLLPALAATTLAGSPAVAKRQAAPAQAPQEEPENDARTPTEPAPAAEAGEASAPAAPKVTAPPTEPARDEAVAPTIQRPLVRISLASPQPEVEFYWRPLEGSPTARATAQAPRAIVRRGPARATLLVEPEPNGYTRLCAAPCEVRLPVGPQELGVSVDYGRNVTGRLFDVAQPTEVAARYGDRWGWRYAGAALIAAGVLTGGALALMRDRQCLPQTASPGPDQPPGAGAVCMDGGRRVGMGLFVAGIGVAIGTPLLFVRDRVDLDARPLPP